MRRIIVFYLLWLSMIGTVAAAQDTQQSQVVCDIGGCSEILLPKPHYSDANAFSIQQIWAVVNEIMQISGLMPNFQVVETEKVDNAAAVIIDGERYLAFNSDWLNRYKSDPDTHWQLYGVMAHEVGHHLQGHTITDSGSRPPTELEADEYAGFTLAALGANLREAQSLWATLSESGSVTHPPRHQRMAAVERGWIRRMGQTQGTIRPKVKTTIPNDSSTSAGQSCFDLWYARNNLFHRNGYCFKTAKAKKYFDNSSCYTSNPSLNDSDMRRVMEIKAREASQGC